MLRGEAPRVRFDAGDSGGDGGGDGIDGKRPQSAEAAEAVAAEAGAAVEGVGEERRFIMAVRRSEGEGTGPLSIAALRRRATAMLAEAVAELKEGSAPLPKEADLAPWAEWLLAKRLRYV